MGLMILGVFWLIVVMLFFGITIVMPIILTINIFSFKYDINFVVLFMNDSMLSMKSVELEACFVTYDLNF